MSLCRLCQSTDTTDAAGLCPGCCTKLGIVDMPPPRRPAVPCVRCNAQRFIRVIPREYTISEGGDLNLPDVAPMTLTQAPVRFERQRGAGNVVGVGKLAKGRGVLETYVCTNCGFVEWYCQDPTSIPIGPEYMSEVVDFATDSPYR